MRLIEKDFRPAFAGRNAGKPATLSEIAGGSSLIRKGLHETKRIPKLC